eukprot:90396-Amphidinium_carterae.1
MIPVVARDFAAAVLNVWRAIGVIENRPPKERWSNSESKGKGWCREPVKAEMEAIAGLWKMSSQP